MKKITKIDSISVLPTHVTNFIDRVTADGGKVVNAPALKDASGSLCIIPSGTKVGKVYGVNPADRIILGPELVKNGTFDTNLDDWVTYGHAEWDVQGMKGTSYGWVIQNNNIPQRVCTLQFSYEIIQAPQAGGYIKANLGGSTNLSMNMTVGKHTHIVVTDGSHSDIKLLWKLIGGIIDNISIKEKINTSGQSDIPFERNSEATYTAKDGTTKVAAINEPRIDYSNGVAELLLEDTSTNIVAISEPTSASHGRYGKQSGKLSYGNDLNVGNYVEYKPSSTNYNQFYYSIATSLVVGTKVTYSLLLNPTNIPYIYIQIGSVSTATFLIFDTTTKTFIRTSPKVVASFKVLKNGWIKFSFSLTIEREQPYFHKIYLSDSSSNAYAGLSDLVNSSCKMTQLQLEIGTKHSSYIKTTGISATRLADTPKPITNIAHLINSEEGVIYLDIKPINTDNSRDIITINDGTNSGSNSITFVIAHDANRFDANIRVGGAYQFIFNYVLPFPSTDHFTALLKYAKDNFALYINGVKVLEDSSGNTFPANTLSALRFSDTNGTKPFKGRIRKLQIFKSIAEAEHHLNIKL